MKFTKHGIDHYEYKGMFYTYKQAVALLKGKGKLKEPKKLKVKKEKPIKKVVKKAKKTTKKR